jgi:AbrB family looped-hinge helix DNA binding protein
MGVVTRLTKKHQTTIPLAVRKVLGLKAGDHVEFVVDGSTVSVRKAPFRMTDEMFFEALSSYAMRDWDTPEDDEAFRDI